MRLKRPEGLNIIPFVDIMLVLLTIVLTISVFVSQQKIRIEIPSATQTQPSNTKMTHEIIVNADNTLSFASNICTLEVVESELIALPSEDTIILRADKQSDFGLFIAIVDLLKKHHHTNVDILVKKE